MSQDEAEILAEAKRVVEGEGMALSYNDDVDWFDDEDEEFSFTDSLGWFEKAWDDGVRELQEMQTIPPRPTVLERVREFLEEYEEPSFYVPLSRPLPEVSRYFEDEVWFGHNADDDVETGDQQEKDLNIDNCVRNSPDV